MKNMSKREQILAAKTIEARRVKNESLSHSGKLSSTVSKIHSSSLLLEVTVTLCVLISLSHLQGYASLNTFVSGVVFVLSLCVLHTPSGSRSPTRTHSFFSSSLTEKRYAS